MPDAWQSFIRGRLSGISIPTAGLPAPVVSCLLGALLLAAGCSQVPTVPSLSLPAPVVGEKIPLASAVGELSLYAADEASDSPQPALLLIHSVNAAGSAYEVRPLLTVTGRKGRCTHWTFLDSALQRETTGAIPRA